MQYFIILIRINSHFLHLTSKQIHAKRYKQGTKINKIIKKVSFLHVI